jgi:hypothetical protein
LQDLRRRVITRLPVLRRSLATGLRHLADRFEPERHTLRQLADGFEPERQTLRRASAPLVRMGGTWWYQDGMRPSGDGGPPPSGLPQ